MASANLSPADSEGRQVRSSLRPPRWIATSLAALYAAVLLVLVDLKPLWLDEVIQLSGTSGASLPGLLKHVAENPGGAPLGYLVQWLFISSMGTSVWAARFQSVLAGAASLAVFFLFCRRLAQCRLTAALAVALWIVCPLTLRYSLEARSYMQAMLFAMLALAAQLKLRERHSATVAITLAACLIAQIYSQPFSVLAPFGFSIVSCWQQRNRRYSAITYGAYAAAVLSFLPWLLAARSYWNAAMAKQPGGFDLGSALLVLLRELAGDGYLASVPAILLAVYAAREYARRPRQDARMALPAGVIASVALVFAADAWFDYFFAIRQVMYMLPFLLLMMAEGLTLLMRRSRRAAGMAVVLLALFTGASLAKSYRHLTDHRENWDRLSAAMARSVDDGCILVPDSDEKSIYAHFRPEIAHRFCGSSLPGRVVLPAHPYRRPHDDRSARERIASSGMSAVSTEEAGFARLDIFVKR